MVRNFKVPSFAGSLRRANRVFGRRIVLEKLFLSRSPFDLVAAPRETGCLSRGMVSAYGRRRRDHDLSPSMGQVVVYRRTKASRLACERAGCCLPPPLAMDEVKTRSIAGRCPLCKRLFAEYWHKSISAKPGKPLEAILRSRAKAFVTSSMYRTDIR